MFYNNETVKKQQKKLRLIDTCFEIESCSLTKVYNQKEIKATTATTIVVAATTIDNNLRNIDNNCLTYVKKHL